MSRRPVVPPPTSDASPIKPARPVAPPMQTLEKRVHLGRAAPPISPRPSKKP